MIKANMIQGRCLCGDITFEVEDDFSEFYFCHCQQCRLLSGSAHVSNLFTRITNIHWLSGKSLLKRYDMPGRQFTNVFCETCGANMPFESKSGKALIVPAGSLLSEPSLKPQKNIFTQEQTQWHKFGVTAEKVLGEP